MKSLTRQLCLAWLAAGVLRAAPPADLQLSTAGDRRAQAEAHFVTAKMLEETGSPREALPHYTSFLSLGGDAGPAVTLHVAELTLAYRDMDAALALLEGRIKSQPESPLPLLDLSEFCQTHAGEKGGLADRAVQVTKEAIASFPQQAEVYAHAAHLHLAQGHRDLAGQVMEQALQQDVKSAAFWNGTGRVAQDVWPLADNEKRAENLQKINAFYEKARDAALSAHDDPGAVQAADYFLFSNQLPASASICEDLVKRSGSHDARRRLVRLYEAMDRPADSLRALEDLVKAFPKDVEHRRLLAGHYIRKRDIGKASEQLEAALRFGDGNVRDYLDICKLLRFDKNSEKFLAFTNRAAQLYPQEPRVAYYGALARSQLKQYPEAVKWFEKCETLAQTKAPDILDDLFHFAHAVALERSGRFEDAAKEFDKSIRLTPAGDPARAASAMNYLGYMWLERGEHLDDAEKIIRKANELQPDNAAYIDSLGWVLFRQGRFAEALKELQRAESLLKDIEPEDAEILDHIAQTHGKLGNRAKAEEYWKRVIDLNPELPKIVQRAKRELGLEKPRPPAPNDAAPAKDQ